MERRIGRRSVLKFGGLLTATAAGRDFLARWLPQPADLIAVPAAPHAGHASHQTAAEPPLGERLYTPQFFKSAEFQTIEILTDLIIPADDKPGAKDGRVAEFIDFVVYSAGEFQSDMQKQWVDGLALLDELSHSEYGRPFREMSAKERERLLTEVSRPEREPHAEHPAYAFYRLVKGMTVEGFYSSKIGLMDVLEYKGMSVNADFPGCTHPEHKT